MFQDSSSGPSWNVNLSKQNAGQLTDALFIMQRMVWVAVGTQGTQRSQSVCWSMKLPPRHGGKKMWTEKQDGWHQSKSGNSNDWNESPNKRCQSERKWRCEKRVGVNFLFSVYLPTCTVVSPSCTSFHLSLFILLLWHFPYLCLLWVVSFLTVAFVCPTPVPHSFLHFSTLALVSPILCLFSHIFFFLVLVATSCCSNLFVFFTFPEN